MAPSTEPRDDTVKCLVILSCLALRAFAQEADPPHIWAFSVGFLAASEIVDVASSRGGNEMNPILGRGTFGAQQEATKSLLVGGIILAEWLILRHYPTHHRAAAIVNFAAGGVTTGVAVRNWRQR
jgi:hypothetical protein